MSLSILILTVSCLTWLYTILPGNKSTLKNVFKIFQNGWISVEMLGFNPYAALARKYLRGTLSNIQTFILSNIQTFVSPKSNLYKHL